MKINQNFFLFFMHSIELVFSSEQLILKQYSFNNAKSLKFSKTFESEKLIISTEYPTNKYGQLECLSLALKYSFSQAISYELLNNSKASCKLYNDYPKLFNDTQTASQSKIYLKTPYTDRYKLTCTTKFLEFSHKLN